MLINSFINHLRSSFRFGFVVFFFALSLSPFTFNIHAHDCSNAFSSDKSADKRGRELVTQFWNNVVKQDVKAYSNQLACTFQGINVQGIYNREDQIQGLSHLTVTSYELRNLVASRYHRTLVISYDFIAQGVGIVSGPSIDVWKRNGKGWKLISHTYVPF